MFDVIYNLAKKYHLKSVYLFGSQARNEADELSDVDLVVDNTNSLATGLSFFTFQRELEDMLHRKVDVLTLDEVDNATTYIGQRVRENYLRDRVLVYEEA
ncbi:nucleotidyltransferase family protein [Streptococcus suis]